MFIESTIKSVAIIGAGPAGLSAIQALEAEGQFETIHVYERKSETGGLWYVDTIFAIIQ